MRLLQWEEIVREVWTVHRGKVLGVFIGLLFALSVVSFGFWKTFFIALCIGVGYALGKRADEDGSLHRYLERWFGD